MSVTCSNQQCEKCHAARVAFLQKEHPVRRLHAVLAIVVAVVLAFVVKVFVAQGSTWVLTGSEPLGYVTLVIGWILLGVTALGALISTVSYVVINGWGMSVIYAIDRAGDFHVHEYSWDFGNERSMADYSVVVRGRIGGWLRSTVIMKGGATWQKVQTWEGAHMTVVDPNGRVRLPIVDALRFIAEQTDMGTVAQRYAGLLAVTVQMSVLEHVAGATNSTLGQSKHGAFAYNHARNAMHKLPEQLREGIRNGSERTAAGILADLRRQENRSA